MFSGLTRPLAPCRLHWRQPVGGSRYLRSEAQPADSGDRHAAVLKQEIAQIAKIICDEELLDGSRKDTGLAARNAPSVEKDASSESAALAHAAGSGYGGIAAAREVNSSPLVPGGAQVAMLAAEIAELRGQLSGLQNVLSQETAVREEQVRHLTAGDGAGRADRGAADNGR